VSKLLCATSVSFVSRHSVVQLEHRFSLLRRTSLSVFVFQMHVLLYFCCH